MAGHVSAAEMVSRQGSDKQVATATEAVDLIFRALCVLQSGLKLGILSVEKVMADSSSSVRTSRQESSRRRCFPIMSYRPCTIETICDGEVCGVSMAETLT